MTTRHPAHVYNTKSEFLASLAEDERSQRWGKRIWKMHIEKNGNVPKIVQSELDDESHA